ncbi:MAG: hypothetical protein IJ692_00900 [Alloprevotella sp.]|nr:hypothetical protein [Alloprevotella sp.]
MKKIFSLFLLAACTFPTWAQTQPEAGKFYTITMKTNSSLYMVENADATLGVTAYATTERIFWEFVPTGNANCYYMRNATTKRYVMSCAGAQKDQISTQAAPVEYYVDASGGYVRFTSTDCANYSNTSATPNGLNKDGASSNVIVWAAGASNNNSWWKLAETEYLFESRTSLPHTSFMKSAQIYDNPCATTSDVYVTSVAAAGHADDAALKYPFSGTSASKPSNGYVLYTKSRGEMRRGQEFTVTVKLSKTPSEGDDVLLYFDYDRDGEFEVCLHPDKVQRTMTFTTTTPEDAVLGESRMRLRLTNNGLAGADDEACGQTLDCVVRTVDKVETAVAMPEADAEVRISASGRMLMASSPQGIAQMEVFDLQGARLAATRADRLSLESVPAGVYVAKVRAQKSRRTYVAKILIR